MAKRLGGMAVMAAIWASSAWADTIAVPAPGLPRDKPATFVYMLDAPLTGTGALAVEWTDVHGRIVERRSQPVTLTGGQSVDFSLDLRRARAIKNTVRARLTLDAAPSSGPIGKHQASAEATFIATPDDDPWRTYQVIMWQGRDAAQYAALKKIGISAGMVIPWRADPGQEMTSPHIAAMLQNDMRWYLENSATDFYAAYHRWTPGKPVNWLYEEARRLYRANPQDIAARIREPSLEDPAWRAIVAERMRRVVAIHAPYAPLYYSLADEPGIADLSANWDFDFGPLSLAGFRDWLRGEYKTLDALNRQWGTRHASWDAIVPPTTTEAMRRKDQNYSAWSDFKDWMNQSFADSVRHGVEAVHAASPQALAALEGMQVPGWGGYDYTRVTQALDLTEIYDFGGNNDIARSMNSRAIQILSSFVGNKGEAHRLWQHWMRGGRGALLWDDDDTVVDVKAEIGPRGLALAASFRERRAGLGALLIASERQIDPIALVYSPASYRARWMLDYRHLGDRWIERDAEREHEDATALRTATTGFLASIRGAGFQPYFIADRDLEQKLAGPGAPKVLILPHVLALSDAAAAAIRNFAAGGGIVVADIVPGDFDQHVRKRAGPVLADLFKKGNLLEPGSVDAMRRTTAAAGLKPVMVADGYELVRYRNGDTTILAILPLAPGKGGGTVRIDLADQAHVTDIRGGRGLGPTTGIDLAVPDEGPLLLALSAAANAGPAIEAPSKASAGETVRVTLRPGAGGNPILRLDVLDPAGGRNEAYSRVLAAGEKAVAIPFAVNDPAGPWTIRVTEILTGRSAEARIDLAPARTP